jgi:hypothetical protein
MKMKLSVHIIFGEKAMTFGRVVISEKGIRKI